MNNTENMEVHELGIPELVEPEIKMKDVLAQEAYFMGDCVKVVLNNGIEKLVSYETFIGILRNVTNTMVDSKMEGFLLPSNVFYFAKSGDSIQMSCYYTSRICNLKYHGDKFDIVTPNIIISHQLQRQPKEGAWKIAGQSRFFCTDVGVGNLPKDFIYNVAAPKRVFLLPMSNTYSEGNMCYGGNQMPMNFTENNLRSLDWYYQYLWESPFNDDLGIRACRGDDNYPSHWYKRLKVCAEKGEPFPYDRLIGYAPR